MRKALVEFLGLQCATVKSLVITLIALPFVALVLPICFVEALFVRWGATHEKFRKLLETPIRIPLPRLFADASVSCDRKFNAYTSLWGGVSDKIDHVLTAVKGQR